MTLTRTPYAAMRDHTGLARATQLELSGTCLVNEGVQIRIFGGVPRITVTASTGYGTMTEAGLDLSSADHRHIASVATALADRMDEGR